MLDGAGRWIEQPYIYPKRLARHDESHYGWRRPRARRGLAIGRHPHGGELNTERRVDSVHELLLLDAQHKRRRRLRREQPQHLTRLPQPEHEIRHDHRRIPHVEMLQGVLDVCFDGFQQVECSGRRRLAGEREEARDRRVEAVEEALLLPCFTAIEALVVIQNGAEPLTRPAAGLRALETQPVHAEVLIRIAEPGAVLPGVEADVPGLAVAHAAPVELQRLPGPQPFLRDLLRKHRRIACCPHRLGREAAGGLMMPVSVAHRAVEPRDDDQGPVEPDDAHHLAQHRFAVPTAHRLVERLGIAIVDGRGEVLVVEAVVATGQA